jgi:hypothetical protein
VEFLSFQEQLNFQISKNGVKISSSKTLKKYLRLSQEYSGFPGNKLEYDAGLFRPTSLQKAIPVF